MWIALDGCIGCGKTTVLRRMAASGIPVLEEPVGNPATGEKGAWDDLLAAMYAGGTKAALALQLRVVYDRGLAPEVVAVGKSDSYALMERSPDVQRRTFARMQGFDVAQAAQVESLYAEAERMWRPAGIIYLRMQPEIAHARTMSRGRACESNVGLDYHTQLHDLHEAAIEALQAEGIVPVTIVDASDGDEEAVCAAVAKAYADFVKNQG